MNWPTKAKTPKYRNKKTTVDGITFDSMAEATRWGSLKLLAESGAIRDLVRQPEYVLIPTVKINGKTVRAMKYRADFGYRKPDGTEIIEDVKGMLTPVYRMKRHMMKALLGLDIVEIHKPK